MPTLPDIITACNQVSRTSRAGRGPILPAEPSAREVARWLAWNDPNGDYSEVVGMPDTDARTVLIESWDDASEVAFYVREASGLP
jgi:hypothetical protein